MPLLRTAFHQDPTRNLRFYAKMSCRPTRAASKYPNSRGTPVSTETTNHEPSPNVIPAPIGSAEPADVSNASENVPSASPDGKPQRPYVGDIGAPLEGARQKASAGFGMLSFAALIGFAVGILVWGVFLLSSILTEFVWGTVAEGLASALDATPLGSWWLPVAICTLGGLVIGLWTKYVGGEPAELEEVMASVKKTGGYQVKSAGASAVGFLLPLMFGGSIGPEAGLTGLIASACTYIGNKLRAAGLKVKGLTDITISATLSAIFGTPLAGAVAATQDALPQCDDDGTPIDPSAYDFRTGAKIALYLSAAFGAVAGIALLGTLLSHEGGLPRFDGIAPSLGDAWWFVPCVIVGYLGAALYHAGNKGFAQASDAMGSKPIAKPVIAGVVLGIAAIGLPYVLFPGEEQSFILMEGWMEMSALVLLGTGLVKCLATPLCLHFGWRGGHFFPCIFAGVSCGYGMAALSGIDPMFCVAITTATLMAGVQRKPLMALALLLLCFPASSLVWMGFAALAGAALPLPKAIDPAKQHESEAVAENADDGAACI